MNLTFSSKVSGAAILAVLSVSTGVHAQQTESSKVETVSRYVLHDLGTLQGGSFSQGSSINRWGLAGGVSTVTSGNQHAALWFQGLKLDLGMHGLGGPNSGVFGLNDSAQAVGQAETTHSDPNNENFCSYFTGLKCKPFVWQFGRMTPLPLLGGNNGTAGNNVNNRGEAPGIAESGKRDNDCPSGIAVNGNGPQVLDYQGVVWDTNQGTLRRLRPLAGDTVGEAFWVNENGVAAGTTGLCSNTQLPPFAAGAHAVLWDRNGTPHDLGTFGGKPNIAVRGIGNIAFAVNNQGHAVGALVRSGNANDEAFFWTKESGLIDLGRFPGDSNSAGLAINNRDEVVGASVNGDLLTGEPHPFLWKNGKLTQLSDLISPETELIPLIASNINDAGEITGFGFNPVSQEIHAFLASPCQHGPAATNWCQEGENFAYPPRKIRPESLKNNIPPIAHKLLEETLGRRVY